MIDDGLTEAKQLLWDTASSSCVTVRCAVSGECLLGAQHEFTFSISCCR